MVGFDEVGISVGFDDVGFAVGEFSGVKVGWPVGLCVGL